MNKKKNKKAQSAIEATVAFGIIFFIFIVVYLIYTEKNQDLLSAHKIIDEREDCLKITNGISSIFTLGTGAEITIRISQEAEIFPNEQRIETGRSSCTFPTRLVSGEISNEPFTVSSGQLKIRNENNLVIINNV